MSEEKQTEQKKINNSNKFQETKLTESNEINMDLKSKSIIKYNNNILSNNQPKNNTKSSLQIIKDINNDMDFISRKIKSNPLINLNLSENNLKNSTVYNSFTNNNFSNNNDYNYNNGKNNDNQISKEEIQNIINKANEYIKKKIDDNKTYNIIIVPNNDHKKYENKFCQSDEHYNNNYIKNYNTINNHNFEYSKDNGFQNFKNNYTQNINNCYKFTNSKTNSSFTIDTNITNSKIKKIDDLYDFTSNPKRKPMIYMQPESKEKVNYKYTIKPNDIRNLYNNRYNNNNINNSHNLENFRRINLKGINKAMDVLMEKI